jgi:hypothetical protein
VKCLRCNTDSNYRERQAWGRCPVCGTPFAFEPRRDRGMTDLTLKLAIEAVSDDGRLAWTDDHLYYDVCRRARRRRILHRLLRRPTMSLDRPTFELLLGRWIDTHGPPQGRLERRVFAASERVRDDSYDFDRLVVCDDDAVADVLLVNGFHADAKCPVLSFSGYPPHVYEALIPQLRERPPARVVVVHDADWHGCRLARAVAEEARWFAGVELHEVLDAGLRPEHARRFRGLWSLAERGVHAAADELSPADVNWLRTYRLELAAVRPRVLMSVLRRALRGETVAAGSDAGAGGVGGDVWDDGDDDDVG